MDHRDPNSYTLKNRRDWKHALSSLAKQGNVAELEAARIALYRFTRSNPGPEQQRAKEEVTQRLKELLRWKAIELCRHIELSPWPKRKILANGSLDVKRLHSELCRVKGLHSGLNGDRRPFTEYTVADYLELGRQLRFKRPYASRLDETFDGYASDDSDLEDEEDELRQVRREYPRVANRHSSRRAALQKSLSDPNPFAPLRYLEPFEDADSELREISARRDRLEKRVHPYLRLAKARKPTFRDYKLDPTLMRRRVIDGLTLYRNLKDASEPERLKKARAKLQEAAKIRAKLKRLKQEQLLALSRMPKSNNRFAVLGNDSVMDRHEVIESLSAEAKTLRDTYQPFLRTWEQTMKEHHLSPDVGWVSNDIQHTINAQIHHGDTWTAQVEADFNAAQDIYRTLQDKMRASSTNAAARAEAQAEAMNALGGLKTKFALAQYRGITYKTSGFGRSDRQSSREKLELGDAIYSFSVFRAAGVSAGDYFAGKCSNDEQRRLRVTASLLKEILIAKRSTEPVRYLNFEYDNHAHALQDTYTNAYDYFHAAIQNHFAPDSWYKAREESAREKLSKGNGWGNKPSEIQKREIEKEGYGGYKPDDSGIYDGLLNADCPFVSTGDVPRHALKYAYGKKFYEGHKHERLQPRWNSTGRSKTPYSGKVYVTLHELCDYIDDDPLHVRSLNNAGRIKVGADIALERESTFPAYIPEGRLVLEHIAKIPSFLSSRGWDETYLHKYGLSEEDYAEHEAAILSEDVQAVGIEGGSYINLDSWLVNYHEVRLVEATRRCAAARGQILVYRDEDGGLSRDVPTPGGIGKSGQARKEEKTLGKREFSSSVVDLARRLCAERVGDVIPEGLKINETRGDGNCLFHALTSAMTDAGVADRTHAQLRTDIGTEFENNQALRNQQGITQEYIDEMKQLARSAGDVDRWGSDAEIIALTRIYPQLRVRVYSPTYPAPTYYSDFENAAGGVVTHTITLRHTGGNHWEWMS